MLLETPTTSQKYFSRILHSSPLPTKRETVTITIIIAKRRRPETKRIRASQIKLAETREVGTRSYTEHFQGEETKETVIASLAIPSILSLAFLLSFSPLNPFPSPVISSSPSHARRRPLSACVYFSLQLRHLRILPTLPFLFLCVCVCMCARIFLLDWVSLTRLLLFFSPGMAERFWRFDSAT